MNELRVDKHTIYKERGEMDIDVLSVNGTWVDYNQHGAKFLLFDEKEEARAFANNLERMLGNVTLKTGFELCYYGTWYHAKYDKEAFGGIERKDLDYILQENWRNNDSWIITESPYANPNRIPTPTGVYYANERRIYCLEAPKISHEHLSSILMEAIPDIMTLPEAEEYWNLQEGTIRLAIHRGYMDHIIKKGNMRRSRGTWLINRNGMFEKYGVPKNIKVG